MNRLKELRMNKKFSRKEVAEQLGIKQRTYTSYENNEREPNSETLIAMASFFGVSIDYLIGRTDIIKPQNDLLICSQDEDFLLFNRLDIVDKAEIRGEIKQMLKAPKYNSKKNMTEFKDYIKSSNAKMIANEVLSIEAISDESPHIIS
jgi:transcriptional regulator with XRE-family HTH domain